MLSIIMPGIRTHLWRRLYNSVSTSLNDEFELVIISPFELPENMRGLDNVKYIQSYAKVPVCLQIGTISAKYDIFCHAVDDSIFLDNTLSRCLDILIQHGLNHVIGLTYQENTNGMIGYDKWAVKNLPEFHLPGIDRSWATFVQPMMYLKEFIALGGMRCNFEYSNHSHHDLAFRYQAAGGNITIPSFPVSVAEHMPERSGDHGPIHDAQMSDVEIFNKLYSEEINPCIDLNNYLLENKIWKRRFKQEYTSYNEMCKKEGYK